MNKKILSKAANYCSYNIIVIIYGILSICLELSSLIFYDCEPYMKQPFFMLVLWSFIFLSLTILRNKRHKAICSLILLLVQGVIILGFNYLFLSNGTVFEKSMLKQRNDAYATIEQFYINKGLLIIFGSTIVSYFIFIKMYLRYIKKHDIIRINHRKRYRSVLVLISIGFLVSLFIFPIHNNSTSKLTNYDALLVRSDNSYQRRGITGNFIYEMIHGGTLNKVDISDTSALDSLIYSKRGDISEYNGISSGNNLIMILAESFEWYPLQTYSKEITESIYPNLSKLLNESALCNNFYSREKTDTAEALMMVGSNPTGKYVHNDFAKNAYPYSLANLFRYQAEKEGDNNVVIKSFHQNKGSFYNRATAHKSFGFEELFDIDAMKKFGVENTWDLSQRERTLDSLTMGALTDEMIPKDQRFFSFWITFSTHGFYNIRESLSEYYDKFDEYGVFPEGTTKQNYLRTYAAAVADFDKALGLMLDDLTNKKLLDKTTIVIIADHNTYYNGLSGYVKKIDTQYNPELYRIPMIIYDKKLVDQMDKNNEDRIISKFTTTSDVIPTLCDMFGIPIWDNLYLGSTIFQNKKESIIYSRAYNIFISNKIIGYSLKNLKYIAPDVTKNMKADFEARARAHLKKLEITDKIFYSDYYSTHTYKP